MSLGQSIKSNPYDEQFLPHRLRKQGDLKTIKVRPYSERRKRRKLERKLKKMNIRF